MKKTPSMLRVLIAYFLLASSLGLAADKQKELHAHFAETCASKKFMGAIAVAVNGKIILSDACGFADAKCNIKNTVDTSMDIRRRIGENLVRNQPALDAVSS